MATVDLRFSQTPAGTDLRFGGDQSGPPSILDATLVATLPGLTFSAMAIPDAKAELVISLPGLTLAAEGRYQSYAVRPTVGRTENPWQRGDGFALGVRDRREATVRDRTLAPLDWRRGIGRQEGCAERLPARLIRMPRCIMMMHQQAEAVLSGPRREGYGDALRRRTGGRSGFAEAVRGTSEPIGLAHEDGLRDRRRRVVSSYAESSRHSGVRQTERLQNGILFHFGPAAVYQNAIVPPPGLHPGGPIIPPEPVPCYVPSGRLLFSGLATLRGDLLFLCERSGPTPENPVVVPVRRVYCVIHTVTLHRWPDGAEVPAFSVGLSLDAASWTWGFEASLPATALWLVEPGDGPVELLARVNGAEFRLLAESLSRERAFGDASIRVAGRGRNAVLAAPYAPVMTFTHTEARTARQLLDDVLTHDGTATGIPLGWTVDFGLTDWTVPAGVFSHQGTRMEALIAVAEAAGGYLLPHRSDLSLAVRHRFPVAPWEWESVSPDIVLPADVVARESLRWQEKPAYNRVFVSGQEAGILGQVTRAGSAGDVLAPMVVDPLITEAAAARQRGLAILADTGRQIEVTLRLPVLAETGIIEPGLFVEYQDGSVARLGLIRSTSVQASLPEVWQTLGVQTYG